MTRMLRRPVLAALLCAVGLAGCGGGGSSTQGSTAATTTAKAATGALSSSQIATATRECKQTVASQSKLPASAKSKLEAACGKAAQGDTSAVKKAAREVCEEVIDKSALPGGAAKEAALSACKK